MNPFKLDTVLVSERMVLDEICEDDLLRATFRKEIPRTNNTTIVKVATTPIKIFAFVFDKMVYVMTIGFNIDYGQKNIK
ncbi:MAG TPA: hypothetical protein VFI73_06040 [Candidatus Nitrosopolaris sp.]|nr:hypothetical protein [Candidatus Nitrosopolaris sp.]